MHFEWFFGFLLGHVNLLALPQHQHTSFLFPRRFGQDCPVLFQGTFELTNDKLKVKKRKNETESKTKYNLEKRQNSMGIRLASSFTGICLANSLNVRVRWKCHRKTNTEKIPGQETKNSLTPKNYIETREIKGRTFVAPCEPHTWFAFLFSCFVLVVFTSL